MGKIKIVSALAAVMTANICLAQKIDSSAVHEMTLVTASGNIYGTLLCPASSEKIQVVLLISGSGPTDRDGNNPMMDNNSLKQLAEVLYTNGIATLRYDKRGIAASASAGGKEADLRFDAYVNDAKAWLDELRKDVRFSNITIIGHSEGSLIGMIAAEKASKFISVAGAGQSADKILKEQLAQQSAGTKEKTYGILDSLKAGYIVKNVPPSLNALFRPSVQPYLISWFKYDPQIELKKLSIPVLIVQGDNDLQVKVSDAERLHKAAKKSKLVIVKDMTHVLKSADPKDRSSNIKTYSNPDLALAEELSTAIINFIKQ